MLSGIRVGSQGGCQLQGLHQSQRLLQNRRLLCPPEGLPGADYGICIWFQPGPEAGQDENLNARDLCLGPKGSSLLEPQSFLLELAGGEQTPPSQEVCVTTTCPQEPRLPDSLQNQRLQAASQNSQINMPGLLTL